MDILVYIEIREGKIRTSSFEAVSAARKLADTASGKVTVLLAGDSLDPLADKVEQFGPDQILLAEHPDLDGYTPEGHRQAMLSAVKETGAQLVMMSATALGRDLGPTVAARLEAAFLPDCTSVEYVEGQLNVVRPVYAGRCIMTLAATGWPVLISLRPKAFPQIPREDHTAERATINVDLDGKIRARLIETRTAGDEKLDVTEADIIVTGGRGMKSAENFQLVEELASALKGAVGVSRPVVDDDWRPHSEQVGQTGKVVAPTLYIACGISGAIQHLAGMNTSKVIVAINKDKDAPIFKSADYGIIGNVLEVLPVLTQAIREID
ncbi:MAG: electron transfer flavoprotein subunit alpha/FixB family protein [Candidatus Electryoneaceae bacterium]|nr:electron transfer flavoprotein subunit alpha/FixB family protein [Candidatus Electryoneaceae bacterium]